MGKISLGHILVAVTVVLSKGAPEGLHVSGPTVCIVVKELQEEIVCLILLGNETLAPRRPLRKPIFSKDGCV